MAENKKVQFLLASGNAHKVCEFLTIFAQNDILKNIEILSLKDIGFTAEIEENGKTFEENALIKAKALSAYPYPVIADDSGLTVDFLDGAPGIYSARYAGVHGDDKANNHKLINALADVPMGKRRAQFVCAIACVFPSGKEILLRETCEGEILTTEKGEGGFGYDPLFYIENKQKTMAELSGDEKNAISHRGKAIRKLAILLEEYFQHA